MGARFQVYAAGLLAGSALAILGACPQRAKATLYTFENSSYTFRQNIGGTTLTFNGRISGSFIYTGDLASPSSFSNVNVRFGAPDPNPLNLSGSYWTSTADYTTAGGGGGTVTTSTSALNFTYGSAQQAIAETPTLTTQVIYFWNTDGDGVSIKLNRALNMSPGDFYTENTTNATGKYFCNAVLDGATTLLTASGIAGSCAANIGSGSTATINQRLFRDLNISLTAPSPGIGLGLLQTLRSRRRTKRTKLIKTASMDQNCYSVN